MNDTKEAGRVLGDLAFGLGAKLDPAKAKGVLVAGGKAKGGRTTTQQLVKQGLGGCSCTRRKVL